MELGGSRIHRFEQFFEHYISTIIDKTPTHALFIQHYISLACWFH